MTHSLYVTLDSKESHRVTLTEEALQDIGFWLTEMCSHMTEWRPMFGGFP